MGEKSTDIQPQTDAVAKGKIHKCLIELIQDII